MKLISYQDRSRAADCRAARQAKSSTCTTPTPGCPVVPRRCLAQGPEAIGRAEKALAAGRPVTAPVTWLPPIPSPEKIICIGLNYADHARETKATVPPCPVVFNKFPTALLPHEGHGPFAAGQRASRLRGRVGAGDRPRRPPHSPSARPAATSPPTPAETTFRPAIGRRTSPAGNGSPARVSTPSRPAAPGWSRPTRSPSRASSAIKLRLNGQVMQDSNTAELIFSVDDAGELHLAVLHLESRRLDFHRHARRRRHGAAAARLPEARRRDRGRDRADRRLAEPLRGRVAE